MRTRLCLVVLLALLGVRHHTDATTIDLVVSRLWLNPDALHRNGVNLVERDMPTDWCVEKGKLRNVKWSAQIGSRSCAPLAVAGGRVFVATNNDKPRDPKVPGDKAILACFRESDGAFLWQAVHDLPKTFGGHSQEKGLGSTPAIAGDRVYYVTPAAEVVCADVRTGIATWRFDMCKAWSVLPRFGNCGSPLSSGTTPLVIDDLVFVVVNNGRDDDGKLPSPQAPSFAAFERHTGKVRWSYCLGEDILSGQWGSPAAALVKGRVQVLFPGGDGWLYAFEAETGKMIWKFDCNPKSAIWKPQGRGTRNYLVATPTIHEDRVYIGAGQDPFDGIGVGHLWCIDMNGRGDVSSEIIAGSSAIPVKLRQNPNSALVWHHGGMPAAPLKDGRDYVFGRTVSNCVIHDGMVYAAETEGYVHCLDARTGKLHWTHDVKEWVVGSLSWIDGKLYVPTAGDGVWIFNHGREKKGCQMVDTENPGKGIAANRGVLFLQSAGTVHAIRK